MSSPLATVEPFMRRERRQRWEGWFSFGCLCFLVFVDSYFSPLVLLAVVCAISVLLTSQRHVREPEDVERNGSEGRNGEVSSNDSVLLLRVPPALVT